MPGKLKESGRAKLSDSERRLLRALEESLLQSAVRSDAARLGELLDDDFREFGASGRTYDKDSVIRALAENPVQPEVRLEGFEIRALANDIALVTYRSENGGRIARRSSIWKRSGAGWKMMFHQGTPISIRGA